ncbi:MAG TPA: hypothetical protein VGL75_17285 [Acidothermaceae bacterium]
MFSTPNTTGEPEAAFGVANGSAGAAADEAGAGADDAGAGADDAGAGADDAGAGADDEGAATDAAAEVAGAGDDDAAVLFLLLEQPAATRLTAAVATSRAVDRRLTIARIFSPLKKGCLAG